MPSEMNASKALVLQNEFNRRKTANPRYSQRAFARDLGVSHTLLSLVATGKRPLSNELAKKLIYEVDLPQQERDILALGLPIDIDESHEEVSLERFSLIADWVSYAILNLLGTKGFTWSGEFIAQRLGIRVSSAKKTMAALVKNDFVQIDESGRARRTGAPFIVKNKRSSDAARKFNNNLLKKASQAMEELPFESRELSSMIFTMDPKFLPYAVDRIRNFRMSLSKELENLGEPNEVYTLAVQMFPLTNTKREEE